MSWLEFDHKGKLYRLAVARAGSGVWVGWPGQSKFFSETGDETSEDRGSHLGEVRAPMTGKIVGVEIAAGSSVAKGQVLVVLEAMKMEYRLAAPRGGVVQTVHCAEGDSVDLGKKLVTLSKPS